VAPPRYYKLEFPTFDGSIDPLNWLTHCEQFFHGQRTQASDRTWLASYHLTGPAQTWYYAIEQDEGMPSWERFNELCNERFRPPVRGSRLAELARLQFTTSVQEYADRFNTVLCHAPNLDPVQKAELFVGGLPDHIRVDVELQSPQDLSTMVRLARGYELRAQALWNALPTGASRPQRPSQRALPPPARPLPLPQPPAPSTAPPGGTTSPTPPSTLPPIR
jgi:hypothetical protein